jgi:hypothetical protein
MEAMVIVLPVILVVLLLGLAGGSSNFIVLLPIIIFGGGGAVFIAIAMRDGRKPPDRSVRRLPTGHLERQIYLAVRPRRPKPQDDRDTE